MDKRNVNKILFETEKGYNKMANKFSETRRFFWCKMEFIANYVKNGDKILDFGCGNGRLLEIFNDKDIDYLGIDISQKLINLAKSKYLSNKHNFKKISSSQSLALPENYFNAIYSIAVFHHLPSSNLRFNITRELFRALKPNGILVISVWNLWQKKYFKSLSYNWINKIFGKNDLDWNDCYISFSDNAGNKFQRFHHAFTKNELINLFSKAGFKIEKCEIMQNRNILLIGRK